MKEITGAFSSAKIFTDVVEENAIEQIQTLCNQPFTEGCRIRVMPDAHSGKGCVIGFTSRAESSAKAQKDCSAEILQGKNLRWKNSAQLWTAFLPPQSEKARWTNAQWHTNL